MKRTIKIDSGRHYFYKGKDRGYITLSTMKRFGLTEGKYTISITEGDEYRFELSWCLPWYTIYKNGAKFDSICAELFDQLFFKPDGRKRYNITVQRKKGK